MGISVLSSPPLITISSTKSLMVKHSFFTDQKSLTFSTISGYPHPRKLKFPPLRAPASEYGQASRKSIPATADATNQEICSKDDDLVFVAGATGKVGSRTVRELLKLGFRIRAGVRSAQRAEALMQSVQQLKLDDGASAVEKLEIVECDLEKDRIEQGIGNASVVVCCIGASEKEILDVTGPYRIDYQATKNLIDAATVAGVNHFILLTSLGTNKIGFPAAILNLFWGVLIWKRKAEEALIASRIPYTIVRPGGMERPTDAYKETHNISLAKEDTLFGGQVSNLQVAELMAFMAKNREVSCCKVVEVIAETTARISPLEELLSRIPPHRVCISSLKESQTAHKMEAAPSQMNVPAATSSVMEKEFTRTKQPILRPSSYILYEDLKQPASPVPTQSTFEASTRDVNAQKTEVPAPSNTRDSSKEPTKTASEKEIVPIDIQKPGSLSPYDDLKPPTSPTPSASSGTKGILKVTQAVSEPIIGANQANVLGSTPTTTETKSATPKVQDKRPLSPYFVYEDLKPPTSPTPVSSARKSGPVAVKAEKEAVTSSSGGSTVTDKTPIEMEEKTPPKALTQKTSYLSPYPVYDDWKPPASPSPCAPTTVPPLSSSTGDVGSVLPPKSNAQVATPGEAEDKHNFVELKARPTTTVPPLSSSTGDVGSVLPPKSNAQVATPGEAEDKHNFVELKARPLSPFAMYEDLKPPSSPRPSPSKC